MSRDCPHCHSHDVRRLNAAITGITGFRCQACNKIFYVPSPTVAKRIQEAQAKSETCDDEPRRRGANADSKIDGHGS